MENPIGSPAICWLKVTDYMMGWFQYEFGGSVKMKEQRVVSVQDLPGARDILMMETQDDIPTGGQPANAMSSTWRNALDAGITIDAAGVERVYGVTKDLLRLYIPIECPRRTLTKYGVIRPWTFDTFFSPKQATAMQRLLREAFWQAVGEYAREYAEEHRGEKYAQVDMIEAFCTSTRTPEIHIEAIRREWQRRCKREQG